MIKKTSKYAIRSNPPKGDATKPVTPPTPENPPPETPATTAPTGIKPEPRPSVYMSPALIPKKQRGYTTQHLKGGENSQPPSSEPGQPPPPAGDAGTPKTSVDEPPPPSSETPPAADAPPAENTAEEQTIDPNAPPAQPGGEAFTLPPGYSAGTSKWVIDAIDYALKNYGKYLTDIRTTKRIKHADRVSEIPEHKNIEATIERRNEKTRKKLPFESEDRQLLEPALERYSRETGFVVTPLQQLLAVVGLVLSKKVPDIVSILNENKEMMKHITIEVDRVIKKWEENKAKPESGKTVTDAELVDDKDEKKDK